MKILVSTSSFGKISAFPLEKLKSAVEEVVLNPYGRRLTEKEVIEMLKETGAVGMIAGTEPLTGEVMKETPSLRVISRCGVGLDNVDLDAAKHLGIRVYNTPDAPSHAVAELTVSLILSVLRRVCEADRAIRNGKWGPLMGRLLQGQIVGIVGCGRIGQKVARLISAFDAHVLGYDPLVKNVSGIEMVDLEELLKTSDVITLHVPYSEGTRHLIDSNAIKQMKQGAVLINTSRGEIVEEDALYHALISGHLAGAGLDTFEKEPYEGPLKDLSNVVLTAHMGSYARESRIQMELEAVENLIKGLEELNVIK